MEENEQRTQISLDEHHWWYRGRRRVLKAALERIELPQEATILDAGCGSGRTLDELASYGRVSGIDASEIAAAAARGRGHQDIQIGHVERLPWSDGTFDLVTALDVIEHTPDDVATLSELRRVTKPGGHALITVPAYQWLFSSHDVANHHYRRYATGALVKAARGAGWKIDFTTYFNSVLLAPTAAIRLAQKHKRDQPKSRSDFEMTPKALTPVLELPLRMEAGWIEAGRRLPVGLSLLGVMVNSG